MCRGAPGRLLSTYFPGEGSGGKDMRQRTSPKNYIVDVLPPVAALQSLALIDQLQKTCIRRSCSTRAP